MKNLIILAITSTSLLLFSCKSKQTAVAATPVEKKPEPKLIPMGNLQTNSNATVYRVIVSCISIGAGSDGRVIKELEEYVKAYGEKGAYEMVKWGREGERDYCFKLEKLTPAEQQEFITKLKGIIGSSTLAAIKENAACEHRR